MNGDKWQWHRNNTRHWKHKFGQFGILIRTLWKSQTRLCIFDYERSLRLKWPSKSSLCMAYVCSIKLGLPRRYHTKRGFVTHAHFFLFSLKVCHITHVPNFKVLWAYPNSDYYRFDQFINKRIDIYQNQTVKVWKYMYQSVWKCSFKVLNIIIV